MLEIKLDRQGFTSFTQVMEACPQLANIYWMEGDITAILSDYFRKKGLEMKEYELKVTVK